MRIKDLVGEQIGAWLEDRKVTKPTQATRAFIV
jgi:hypothetical protein